MPLLLIGSLPRRALIIFETYRSSVSDWWAVPVSSPDIGPSTLRSKIAYVQNGTG